MGYILNNTFNFLGNIIYKYKLLILSSISYYYYSSYRFDKINFYLIIYTLYIKYSYYIKIIYIIFIFTYPGLNTLPNMAFRPLILYIIFM